MTALPALLGALIAAVISTALSAAVAWAGPLDRPRARGAHDRPIATSGGLAIMAGASLGLLVFLALEPGARSGLGRIAACLAYAGGLGVFGAADDLFDFGAKAKLLVQAAASLAFAVLVARIEALPVADGLGVGLGPVAGALGTTLWLVVATNAVNFMDGADGLAAGSVAIAGIGFALAAVLGGAGAIGGAALAGAAAALGFLPWNLWRRRLFQGDAGALFSSALLASLAVMAAGPRGAGAVYLYAAPLMLLPFLTDVLMTLLSRARRGQSLFAAHREHLYQLWLAHTGKPHAALAWRVYLLMVVYAGVAIAAIALPMTGRAALFAGAVLVSAAGWAALRRALNASASRPRRTPPALPPR